MTIFGELPLFAGFHCAIGREKLYEHIDARFFSIQGAWGLGKTTALRHLAEEQATKTPAHRVLWVDTHVLAQLEASEAEELLGQSIDPEEPTLIVVDDAHLIGEEKFVNTIEIGLASFPLLKIAVSSRREAFRPLSGYRTRGLVCEIVEPELVCTLDDIHEWLRSEQLWLTDEDLQFVADGTEGWPLAVGRIVADLATGTDELPRHVIINTMRRISEEIASGAKELLERDDFDFLKKMSVVEQFSNASAISISGDTDGARRVLFLTREHSLIKTVDRNAEFYRIPRILRSGLLESLSSAEQNELLQRAAVSFETAGDRQSAIRSLVSAGEHRLASEVLARWWGIDYLHAAQQDPSTIDDPSLDQDPIHLVNRILHAASSNDVDKLADLRLRFEATGFDKALPQGFSGGSFAALCREDANELSEARLRTENDYLRREALEGPEHTHRVIGFAYAYRQYLHGEIDNAAHLLEVICVGRRALGRVADADKTITTLAVALQALIAHDRGHDADAQRLLGESRQLQRTLAGVPIHPLVRNILPLADAIVGRRHQDDQELLLREIVDDKDELPQSRAHAAIQLARAHDRNGYPQLAEEAIVHATEHIQGLHVPLLEHRVAQMRQALQLEKKQRGEIPIHITTGERLVLVSLLAEQTQADVATSLGLSINTVKSHLRSIYQKLQVSNRTEALDAAYERGLLTSFVPWLPPE